MSEAALALISRKTLRVAIQADDPGRRAGLCQVVSGVGHEVVASTDFADVALADGDQSASHSVPIVTLGGADIDQAGLLPSDANPEQIDAALRAVAAGLVVRAIENAAAGFDAMPERSLQTLLTPREIEVLSAIAYGLSNKAIARRLNISLHTVKFHIESLLRKLSAHSRAEAVAIATSVPGTCRSNARADLMSASEKGPTLPERPGWARNRSDWPRAACLLSGPQCGRPDTDGGTGASAAADPTGDTDEAADVWLPRHRVRCDRKRPATGPRKAGRLLCAGSAAPAGQGWSAVGGGRRHVGWADTAASSPSIPRGACRPAVHTRTARLH
jgi:DNA-binding CsgD family transcriptional regulator